MSPIKGFQMEDDVKDHDLRPRRVASDLAEPNGLSQEKEALYTHHSNPTLDL